MAYSTTVTRHKTREVGVGDHVVGGSNPIWVQSMTTSDTQDIAATVRDGALAFACEVHNPGPEPLPYGLGFHPAFPWPFADGVRAAGGGYAVRFDEPERPAVPEVGAGGLLVRTERPLPLEGDTLPLDPDLFTEALVFLNARSRTMRFTAPSCLAVCCDGNAPMPFARGTFRYAICSDAFMYIWTKRQFVLDLLLDIGRYA